jgi:hypothetical protein
VTTVAGNLRDLIGTPADFFTDVFGTFPYRYRSQTAGELISSRLIWDELGCGLLLRPYFDLVTPAGPVRHDAYVTRNVVNNPLDGYPDVTAVRRHHAAGATVVLREPELWSPELAALKASLQKSFRAEVRTDCYLAPAGKAVPMLDAAGESHAFVVQIEGSSGWAVGADGPGSFTTTLVPGDVVYLPPGTAHQAKITSDGSLILVVSVREATATQIAEIVSALFLRGPQAEAIAGTHHTMPVTDKIEWLRGALVEHLDRLDRKVVLETVLTHGRR